MIPHITDEIKARVIDAAEGADIAIVEIGGTVGDIESLPFLEAMRQLIIEKGHENAMSVHVTLVPYIPTAGEMKTKPTQHSVREMREIGIQPDLLICRCDRNITQHMKEKISLFSNVPVERVIPAASAPSASNHLALDLRPLAASRCLRDTPVYCTQWTIPWVNWQPLSCAPRHSIPPLAAHSIK